MLANDEVLITETSEPGRLALFDAHAHRREAEALRKALVAVAYRVTNDIEQAKDIVQDTYVTSLEKAKAFRGGSSLKTYLYRIVINKSIDARRSKARWFGLLDVFGFDFPQPGKTHDRNFESKDFIRAVFSGIPDLYRVPLILAEFEDMAYEEIADTLKISVNTVRTRIFRCREKLRKAFEKTGRSL